jgi:hypothetical protein
MTVSDVARTLVLGTSTLHTPSRDGLLAYYSSSAKKD